MQKINSLLIFASSFIVFINIPIPKLQHLEKWNFNLGVQKETNMNFITVTFIRHGETDFNRQQLVQGDSDLALNDLGIQQAKLVGNYLANEKFTRIYASDLKRAEQTCKIIHEYLTDSAPDIKLDANLREKSFGDWEGKPIKDMMAAAKEAGINFLQYSGNGEPHEKTLGRTITFLEELFKICDEAEDLNGNENILVVSHGMQIISTILHLHSTKDRFVVENFSMRDLISKKTENTSKTTLRIYKLEEEAGRRRIEVLDFAETPHLK